MVELIEVEAQPAAFEEYLTGHLQFLRATATAAHQARSFSPVVGERLLAQYGEALTQQQFDCTQASRAEMEWYGVLGRLVSHMRSIPCQR